MADHIAPPSVPELTPQLWADLERSGYYPALVAGALADSLGAERPVDHLVHQETTLDDALEVRRHVTVLALTPTRLVVCHTDEHGPSEVAPYAHATTTVEAIALSRVATVALTTMMAEPTTYRPGVPPREATLIIGWGAIGRVDLEPAICGDNGCEADHGYSGSFAADDFSLRVSEDADGLESVTRTIQFAAALSQASAGLRA